MATMTVAEASRRLGVKPATLYAYVSRGLLAGRRAADGRTTLFDADDIERLARRGRPRRASSPPSFELVIETAITEITPRDVRYRNRSSTALAATATFEQVAELLWTGTLAPHTPWPSVPIPIGADLRGIPRLQAVLAFAADADPLRVDLERDAVIGRARRIVAALVDAPGHPSIPALPRPDGDAIIEGSVAGRLWHRLHDEPPRAGALEALNAVLVLLADHELAASTLAARVAASTRADPYAVVASALGAVSGPLHGGASRAARAMIDASARIGPEAALAEALSIYGTYPGFGQRLYPDGDPRAVALMPYVRRIQGRAGAVGEVEAVAEAARARVGVHPNVDFALAGLGHVADWPARAGEIVFAVARTTGWIAHALEEYGEAGVRFRPRAVYVGARA